MLRHLCHPHLHSLYHLVWSCSPLSGLYQAQAPQGLHLEMLCCSWGMHSHIASEDLSGHTTLAPPHSTATKSHSRLKIPSALSQYHYPLPVPVFACVIVQEWVVEISTRVSRSVFKIVIMIWKKKRSAVLLNKNSTVNTPQSTSHVLPLLKRSF